MSRTQPSRLRPNAFLSSRRWQHVRLAILQRDQWVCWLCGQPGADSVDHVLPVSRGGAHYDPSNLRAAHLNCNRGKGDRECEPVITTRKW